MDLRRVRTGEWLAGLGGVALLVLLFVPWYELQEVLVPTGTPTSELGIDAWQAFSVVDILLLITALAGLAVPVFAASSRPPAVPVATLVIASAIALIMALVVAYRLVNQPGDNDLIGVELGGYLGLLAVLVILAGGWRGMADERTEANPAPLVPAQPAPPAVAAAGSVVAEGGVPEAAPQRDN